MIARRRRRVKKPIQEEAREIEKRPPPGFEVREGDRLTVTYGSAKLSIASYSSVETDSAYYSRTLNPGDDAQEQWDTIYAFLERECQAVMRRKLKAFVDEYKNAKEG